MPVQPASFRLRIPPRFTAEQLANGTSAHSAEWLATSHYNPDAAKKLGYKGANVHGDIEGRVTSALLDVWGPVVLERSESYSRRRQPLYAEEEIDVIFSPLQDVDGAVRCDYQAVNDEGVACVVGWVALHHAPMTPPDLADFPFTGWRDVPIKLIEAEKHIGEFLASEVVNDPKGPDGPSRAIEFGATDPSGVSPRLRTLPATLLAAYPELPRNGLVPGPMAGGSQRPDLDREGTNIAAMYDGTSKLFGIPTLDDKLTRHTRISDAFERNGNKYLQQETLVVANDRTPIAWSQSTSLIYRPPRKPA